MLSGSKDDQRILYMIYNKLLLIGDLNPPPKKKKLFEILKTNTLTMQVILWDFSG